MEFITEVVNKVKGVFDPEDGEPGTGTGTGAEPERVPVLGQEHETVTELPGHGNVTESVTEPVATGGGKKRKRTRRSRKRKLTRNRRRNVRSTRRKLSKRSK